MLLTQPALGQIETFAHVVEIRSGPPVLGVLPERVGVVVLLVYRQRQRQVAVQLVQDLSFEPWESQLVCSRAGEHTNKDLLHCETIVPAKRLYPSDIAYMKASW